MKALLKKRCEDTLDAIAAHGRGEPVQAYYPTSGVWERDPNPSWDTGTWYRIAPEPIKLWVRISASKVASKVAVGAAYTEEELQNLDINTSGLTKFIQVLDD